MARAIVEANAPRGNGHERELHAEVSYVVAHGIATIVNGRAVRIGSAHFLFEDLGVERPSGLDELIDREAPASSVIYIACESALIGAICVDDPPRDEAAEVLRELRRAGIDRQVMLTGDSERSAAHVAGLLGLDAYHAQVLSEDKGGYVRRLRDEGHVVAMVGDGINDSPALATADVSVALSDASDIARAVADVLVLEGQLGSLVELRELSERMMERIRHDYFLIVAVNTALIVLGVGGAMSISTAALLHNLTTLGLAAANTRPLLGAPRLVRP
jgi:P-type E1-E2 ATPase